MFSDQRIFGFRPLLTGLTAFALVMLLPFVARAQECSATHNVEITHVFGPGDVYLKPGECVRFVNVHTIEHSAVGLEREFNSGILMPGSTATLRFDEPIIIPFTCGVHPPMVGVIVVEAPGASGLAPTAVVGEKVSETSIEGDPIAGKKVFNKCKVCHLLEEDGINRIGPNLFGIIGRTSGTLQNFKYSRAMRNAGIVWDQKSLSRYLIKPQSFVPGTKMAFRGLDTTEEINNVVAYITEQTK